MIKWVIWSMPFLAEFSGSTPIFYFISRCSITFLNVRYQKIFEPSHVAPNLLDTSNRATVLVVMETVKGMFIRYEGG